MVEILFVLQTAIGAVNAIREGCQMLSEGKAEIDKFKKQVEGGVANAKAIYKEVTGFWGWVKGLFSGGAKPPPPAVLPSPPAVAESLPTTPTPAKKRKEPKRELSYEEYQAQAVHEICENLKVYFEAMRQLKLHCQELEQSSLDTDRVAESAIDRIELEWQMKQLSTQVKEAMIYTPEHLGLQALYSRFLEMYDQILEEQEFARAVKAKKERDAKWQRELLRNHRIDRAVVSVVVMLAILWMWAFLLSLGWLVKTHDGSLQASSFCRLCCSSSCLSVSSSPWTTRSG